jgi:WD40 repeat protein
MRAGKELCCLHGHRGKVHAAIFLGHHRFALSAGEDRTVRHWDLQQGTELRCYPDRTNSSLCVSPDCRHALSGSISDGMIRLWEVSTGRELRRFNGHMSWVLSLAFSASDRLALSASADGTVRLWEVDTGRELRRMLGHKGEVSGAVFVGVADQHALSCGADRTVRLWDLRSGKEVACFDKSAEPVRCVATSADRRFALFDGDRNSVRLCELVWTGRPWKLERHQELAPLQSHGDRVLSVAVSPDSKLAASGSEDETIIIWALPG